MSWNQVRWLIIEVLIIFFLHLPATEKWRLSYPTYWFSCRSFCNCCFFLFCLFHVCSVRFPHLSGAVVRFYVSQPAFLLPPPSSSVVRRTPTATSGSERSPPDLHRKLRIRAFPPGPQPRRNSEDIMPDKMPERISEDIPDTYARKDVR